MPLKMIVTSLGSKTETKVLRQYSRRAQNSDHDPVVSGLSEMLSTRAK